MYQFFTEPSAIDGTAVSVSGRDYNHIRNVLRLRPGEEVSVVTTGAEEYRCAIESFDEDSQTVRLRLLFIKQENVELPCRIYLFQGLPKGDKLELIIQKAVELGAYEVIPVSMKRSVVRLDEKKIRKRTERYQAVSEAAAKQAKRRIIPRIREVLSFEEALLYCDEKEIGIRLLPYELCDPSSMERTRSILGSIRPGQQIAVFIGPEGGFSEEEIDLARKKGCEEITLGRRILRTETAGMTVLSWLVYLLESPWPESRAVGPDTGI